MSTSLSTLTPIADQPIRTPGGSSPKPSIQPIQAVRRHPLVAALSFLAIFLCGGFLLRIYLKPSYTAQSVVYVSPNFPQALADNHEHDRSYQEFIEQQIYAVTRYDNLKQAVQKYAEVWMLPNEDEQSAITRLQKALKVNQMGRSYQMSIELQASKADQLADLVNQVTSGYLKQARNDESFGGEERIQTLTADRQRISQDLDEALSQQDKLLGTLGIAQFDAKNAVNPFDAQAQQLREQLAAAHEKRAIADAQVYAINAKQGAAGSSTADELAGAQLRTDPTVMTMESQLNTRRAALLLQMNGLTPTNPLYSQSKAELDAIDKELEDLRSSATKRVAGELQRKAASERQSAAHLEAQLNGDLSRTTSLAAQAAPRLLQAQMLSDRIARLQASYTTIDARINNLKLDSSSPGSEHIVSWAIPPSRPSHKSRTLAALALALMGLFGAAIAAVIADTLDPNIYSASDIHRMLGFPPIGMLLDEKDFSSKMTSEYMLRLAGGIDQAHRRTGARTFVFTSAGTGETNGLVKELGSELAANGLNTLVVFLSDKETSSTKASDAPAVTAPVLQSVLATGSQSTESSLKVRTRPETPHPLCTSVTVPARGAADFMRKARTSYNTVLVAADPLLTSANTEYLARAADGTVLVAESGEVSKDQLARVARLLERLKISGIAVILSRIPKRRADREISDNANEYAQTSST